VARKNLVALISKDSVPEQTKEITTGERDNLGLPETAAKIKPVVIHL